mmetsp:Transcript_2490/g.10678  ORF Transcript_2490/g.10678 Transcript_2490/m.10678 type:complete len:470 (-) Transcript_2490:2807-4216(-)
MKEERLASFDGGSAASCLRTLHHEGRDKSDGAYETNFILDRNCTQKTSSMVRLSNTTNPCSLPRRPAPQISSTCHGRLDPRPISDQSFLNSCARQLISYMTAHGYAAVLSPKTLMAPSSKEFASVAIFLFRRADGNFKFGAKAEDDVPTFFKQLRHPFQISKCTLYAVGSLHTWPALLSALTWLVQLYIYEEEAKCPAKEVHDRTDALFITCASCAYQHFLRGDDIICNNLEHEFVSTVYRSLSEKHTKLRVLEQENAELDGLLKLMLKECEIRTPVHKEKVDHAFMASKYIYLARDLEELCTNVNSQSTDIFTESLRRKDRRDELHADLVNLQNMMRASDDLNQVQENGGRSTVGCSGSLQLRHANSESSLLVVKGSLTQTTSEARDNILVYNELVERTGAFPQRRNYAKGESIHEEIYLNTRDVDRLGDGPFIVSCRCTLQNAHESHTQRKWSVQRDDDRHSVSLMR